MRLAERSNATYVQASHYELYKLEPTKRKQSRSWFDSEKLQHLPRLVSSKDSLKVVQLIIIRFFVIIDRGQIILKTQKKLKIV